MVIFPNKKTDGVQVPNTLITVNNTPDYKVLDAPNIDWDAYQMDWPKSVYKFASGERNSDDEESKQNNAIDWYTPGVKFHDSDELPSWKDGLINDSEQVIDMIDYLMWRVANLDYFCDHWNLRDSKVVNINLVCEKTENPTGFIGSWYDVRNQIASNPIYQSIPTANFYNNHYLKVNSSSGDFNLSLEPSTSNTQYTILRETGYSNLDAYIKTRNYFGNKYVLFSDSNGRISINVTGGNASVSVDNDLSPVAINNENTLFAIDLPIKVYGTTNYFFPSKSYIKALYDNTTSLEDDNWKKNSENYYLDPCFNSSTGASEPVTCNLSIRQNPSTVNGIQFGEGSSLLYLKIHKAKIGVEFGVDGNVNASGMCIPYYSDVLSNNDYAITFEIEEDNDYGISTIGELINYGMYPFFFITAEDGTRDIDYRLSISDNNEFESFESDLYGSITVNSGNYIYTPPREQNSYDKTIIIYCFIYYKDGNNNDVLPRCRAFEPVLAEFKVTLTAEKKNRIVFLDRDSKPGTLLRWNDDLKKYDEANFTVNIQGTDDDGIPNGASIFIDKNQIHYMDINGEPNNIVDYAVKDIVIGDERYGGSEKAIIISEVNTDIATSLYTDDVKIEFYGIAKQNSLVDREFSFNDGCIKINNILRPAFSIEEDSESLIGEDYSHEPCPYKYIKDDSPSNYRLYTGDDLLVRNENITSQLTLDPSLSSVKNTEFGSINVSGISSMLGLQDISAGTIYGSNSEARIIMTGGSNNEYTGVILPSTSAMFPYLNGLVSSNNMMDNSTIWDDQTGLEYPDTVYDADNDYFYYVFRIYCNAGSDVEGGGSVYSAAEAYYFVRVLRNQKEFMLSFRNLTLDDHIVTYEGPDEVEYQNAPITRSIIYLNRMLSDQSIQNNEDIKGKQWWYIYGTHSHDTGVVLNKQELAIDNGYSYTDSNDDVINVPKTEDFISIYNEGEKFKVYSGYSRLELNTENKFDMTENDWIYDPEGDYTVTVGKFNINSGNTIYSGPVLYINKLKRMINKTPEAGDTTDTLFTAITGNYQEIPLSVIVGNSDRYNRIIANTSGKLKVFKKKYDFKLYTTKESSIGAFTEVASLYSNPIRIKNSSSFINDNIIERTSEYAGIINTEYAYPLYFCSQEFSRDDHPDQTNRKDTVKFGPGGVLYTDVYGTYPAIQLVNANNSSWIVGPDPEDNTNKWPDIQISQADALLHPIQLYHYSSDDDPEVGTAEQFFGLIQVYGFSTNSTPSEIIFKVTEDSDGIYAEKSFSTFFTVID